MVTKLMKCRLTDKMEKTEQHIQIEDIYNEDMSQSNMPMPEPKKFIPA
jgi:hypothetical protein